MSEIKVRLSMEVPGATMLSSQDCEKMSKKKAYNSFKLVVGYKAKQGKKSIMKREVLHISTRAAKPARQNISISKEAYSYMTDAKEIPSSKLTKVWGKMSIAQRLEYHFNLIAEHFGATSFSYEVLDD